MLDSLTSASSTDNKLDSANSIFFAAKPSSLNSHTPVATVVIIRIPLLYSSADYTRHKI